MSASLRKVSIYLIQSLIDNILRIGDLFLIILLIIVAIIENRKFSVCFEFVKSSCTLVYLGVKTSLIQLIFDVFLGSHHEGGSRYRRCSRYEYREKQRIVVQINRQVRILLCMCLISHSIVLWSYGNLLISLEFGTLVKLSDYTL